MIRQFATALCLVCTASFLIHADRLTVLTWIAEASSQLESLANPGAEEADPSAADSVSAGPVIVIEAPKVDGAGEIAWPDNATTEFDFPCCPIPQHGRGCCW